MTDLLFEKRVYDDHNATYHNAFEIRTGMEKKQFKIYLDSQEVLLEKLVCKVQGPYARLELLPGDFSPIFFWGVSIACCAGWQVEHFDSNPPDCRVDLVCAVYHSD